MQENKLVNTVKSTIKNLTYFVGFYFFINSGCALANYQAHHNVEERGYKERIITKADGIHTHTTLRIKDNGGLELTLGPTFLREIVLGGVTSYFDENGDRDPDRFYVERGFNISEGSLRDWVDRVHLLEKDPDLYRGAVEEFNDQMKRFSFYLSG